MKTVRKITAILLAAVMMICAASVNGYAVEEESMIEDIRLYQDVEGENIIKCLHYPGFSDDSEVSIYEVTESGEKLLVKEFSEDEVFSFVHAYPVFIPGLSADKKYCFEVIESYYDEEDNIVCETVYYDFTCDDINAEAPAFLNFDIVLNENETYDLRDNLLFPIGYESGVRVEVLSYSEFFEETVLYIEPEYAKVEGYELTALNDGSVYLCLYDNSGERIDIGMLEIVEAEPDSFGEKLFDAYEDFTVALSDMANNSIFLGFFGGAWILILLAAPFALIATLVFGI